MSEKDNLSEKDKLLRTIRKLLIIVAIGIPALYLLLFLLLIAINFFGR